MPTHSPGSAQTNNCLFPRCFQFKHVMQPFHVSLQPGGVEISRRRDDNNGEDNPDKGGSASDLSASGSITTVAVALSIENRFDFTDDLWEVLEFEWKVEVDGVVVASGAELAPSDPRPLPPSRSDSDREQGASQGKSGGGTGSGDDSGSDKKGGCGECTTARLAFETSSLPLPGEECLLTVTGRLRAKLPWAAAGHVVGHTQLELELPTSDEVMRRLLGFSKADRVDLGYKCTVG